MSMIGLCRTIHVFSKTMRPWQSCFGAIFISRTSSLHYIYIYIYECFSFHDECWDMLTMQIPVHRKESTMLCSVFSREYSLGFYVIQVLWRVIYDWCRNVYALLLLMIFLLSFMLCSHVLNDYAIEIHVVLCDCLDSKLIFKLPCEHGDPWFVYSGECLGLSW